MGLVTTISSPRPTAAAQQLLDLLEPELRREVVRLAQREPRVQDTAWLARYRIPGGEAVRISVDPFETPPLAMPYRTADGRDVCAVLVGDGRG